MFKKLLVALSVLLVSVVSVSAQAAVHNKKLAVIHINPVNPSNPNERLIDRLGWPAPLTTSVIDTINRATEGRVQYQVVNSFTINTFPARLDGQTWTFDNYVNCATVPTGRFPEGFCTPPTGGGYNTVMTAMTGLNLCEKIRAAELDEVWIWAPYYTGFDEFAYKVPGDNLYYTSKEGNFWLYDGRRYDLPDCGRPYFVMGFVAEAGIANALHSYGHRAESALSLSAPGQGYFNGCALNAPAAKNEWTDFVCYDTRKPGSAGCGDVHHTPNSLTDYEYGNTTLKPSSCADWLNYPNRTGATQQVNVNTWMQTGSQPHAGNDHESYMEWWFKHLPHKDGSHVDANGVTVSNDWWNFILNYQDPHSSQGPLHNFPQVHLRGTHNGWAAGSMMTLVGNFTWETIVTFGSTSSERFKFDVNGDWSQNYGDNNADGIVERTGADISITQGVGSYKISLNDQTLVYTITKLNFGNTPPVANAGNDVTVVGPVGTVTLSANGSFDPNGDVLTFSWLQTAGRPITLSNTNTANPSFVLNAEPIGSASNPNDVFEFKVTVDDGRGGVSSDFVVITHAPSPTSVTITFKPTVTTVPGQMVYVVGNKTQLSNWNSAAGVPCTTTAATYPVWTCQGFNLTPGTTFEYKYIKRDGSGAVVWESGANRSRTAPSTSSTFSETWK